MRCVACNVPLNDFEATRKSKNTGEYVDLCNSCFTVARPDNSPMYERFDLISEADNLDGTVVEDTTFGTVENFSSVKGLTGSDDTIK